MPSLFVCPLDSSDGAEALSPTENCNEESGLSLAAALDKRALRLRPGLEQRKEEADRIHTFTALAWRLWAGQCNTGQDAISGVIALSR